MPSQVGADVFAKRPAGPGDQLAGDLARLVAEDLDGAVVRLPRRFEGVRRAGSEHFMVPKPAYPAHSHRFTSSCVL